MHELYIIGDIGNTDVKICIYKHKTIIKKIRLTTDKVNLKYLKKNLNTLRKYDKNLKQILFCSVVPSCYKKIRNYFKLYFNTNCNELKNLNLNKLLNIKVDRKQIGSDRLANAISIIDNKNNYIVVDFGTATNFDVITSNCYNGGVIAPGINLSLDNLSKKASLIPNIKFKKSNNVIGKNTISAINSGFFFGYTGLIDNIIHSIIKQSKKKYKIIFTGGLAEMFKNSLKLKLKLKIHIKSNLTTDGVLKAAMYSNK